MPFPAKTNTDAIIKSATDIIRVGGLPSLSMRTLAARLGVRASSLYRHFPDRSAIEKTLAKRAAEQLFEKMLHATDGLTGETALLAASAAYLEYATVEASFYEIIMQVSSGRPETVKSTKMVWEFFIRLVSNTTQLGEDVAGAAALWSFLHGCSLLCKSGQLGDMPANLAFSRGTQALIRGLSVAEAKVVSAPS